MAHLITAALMFGALILGLTLLAVMRAHGLDPVGKLTAFFTAPPSAPSA